MQLPFWLLSWGETRLDSGLASIIQGAVPIFNAVIAFGFFRDVRVTGLRLPKGSSAQGVKGKRRRKSTARRQGAEEARRKIGAAALSLPAPLV